MATNSNDDADWSCASSRSSRPSLADVVVDREKVVRGVRSVSLVAMIGIAAAFARGCWDLTNWNLVAETVYFALALVPRLDTTVLRGVVVPLSLVAVASSWRDGGGGATTERVVSANVVPTLLVLVDAALTPASCLPGSVAFFALMLAHLAFVIVHYFSRSKCDGHRGVYQGVDWNRPSAPRTLLYAVVLGAGVPLLNVAFCLAFDYLYSQRRRTTTLNYSDDKRPRRRCWGRERGGSKQNDEEEQRTTTSESEPAEPSPSERRVELP